MVNVKWQDIFVPSFYEDRNAVSRASVLNVDKTTGNIILMAMAWDNHVISNYAIRGYSGSGSILYTIDYGAGYDNHSQSDETSRSNEKVAKSREVKSDHSAASGDLTIFPEFGLSQNYPNPFNPVTLIRYSLKENSYVIVKVFDLAGKEITTLINESRDIGQHSVSFDASSLSSGVYYYKLIVNGVAKDAKRMMLVK